MVKFALLVLIVGLVAAVKLLPWWAGVVLLIAAAVAARYALPRLLKRMFLAPFVAKGRVLHGASLKLLEAAPTEPFEWGEPFPEGARIMSLDVMIRPAAGDGPFQAWEPSSLELVPADAPPEDPYADDEATSDAPPAAVVGPIEVWQDGAWVPDEGFKLVGEQRVRLKAALAPGKPGFKLRYYFEDVGPLPGVAA